MTRQKTDITSEQIGKIQEMLAVCLRKSDLQSGPVQQVLHTQGNESADEMFEVIRKRAEASSNKMVHPTRVNPNLRLDPMYDEFFDGWIFKEGEEY